MLMMSVQKAPRLKQTATDAHDALKGTGSLGADAGGGNCWHHLLRMVKYGFGQRVTRLADYAQLLVMKSSDPDLRFSASGLGLLLKAVYIYIYIYYIIYIYIKYFFNCW